MARSEANLIRQSDSWVRFLLTVALLAGAGIFVWSRGEAEVVPPHRSLSSFPLRIGDWTGMDRGIKGDNRALSGDGDFLSRVYQPAADEAYVDLYIAYFPTQRTESTIHSPQNCLPGAGWTPIEHNRIQLEKSGGERMTVNHYVIVKGEDRRLVLYWYQAHGRVVASEYWGEFYLVTDAIQMNRTDGAFVRIVTPWRLDEPRAHAENRSKEFAENLVPWLREYLP